MSIWSDLQDRSSGEIIRKEDIFSFKDLHFVVKKEEDLEETEEQSIAKAALAEFKFGGFASLDEILEKLGVTLVISARTPTRTVPAAISEWELYWKNELNRLEGLGHKEGQLHAEAEEEAKKASAEAVDWSKMPLLGCYDRFSKTIYIYPNNMEQGEVRGKYLVTTFVHEAMHAFFDRHHHELFSYVATVEEPLAEFGMLLFLNETNSKDPDYKWAYDIVKNKKTCYRYGASLMDQYLREGAGSRTRRDLESYKIKLF